MIINLERFESLVDLEGKVSLRGSEYLREITRQMNLSTTLSGSGSPEGVLTAIPTQLYMDTAGSAGTVLYIKQTGTGNTGWLNVNS